MSRTLQRILAWAIRCWSSLAQWWQSQRWPMRLYSGGAIVMLVSLLFALTGMTYRDVHQTVFVLGALLLALGILLEGYRLANVGMATRPGKVVAALIATMIGSLSMGISSVIVNQATGFPPSEFPYTVTFLAPLTAGHVILLMTVVLFILVPVVILAMGTMSIWQALFQPGRRIDREYIQMMARLMAAITLFVLIIHAWQKQHASYESRLTSAASWFAYTFEMYGNDACVRYKGERVRRIESDEALIGYERNGQRAFFARRCEPPVFD